MLKTLYSTYNIGITRRKLAPIPKIGRDMHIFRKWPIPWQRHKSPVSQTNFGNWGPIFVMGGQFYMHYIKFGISDVGADGVRSNNNYI